MKTQRPKPEKFVKRAQEEARKEKQGKLKIYLGAAPGVGKTYMMLHDALAKREEGLDVVVGIVESHGREEIIEFLKKFEVLPYQTVEYRDKSLPEFDLDGALKRSPGLILIDEMAHTNVPGLRHEKRWQDIKEILDRGIDVYTTLNVQHIETLNDVVAQIIQIRINETVPDSMLEIADTIELVDLPPEDLLKRLEEGKIYFPEQAQIAKENFFQKGNLIALRELALRVTAEHVETQVLLYRQGQGIKHIWPTKEKILVCMSWGPEPIRLVRTARRLAASQQADWVAIHVDTWNIHRSEEKRNQAFKNLRFAEKLGAETHVLVGEDIVNEIMNFAREQNVTQIIVWKTIRPRWQSLFWENIADTITRESNEIDVYIITGEAHEKFFSSQFLRQSTSNWKHYIIAVGAATLTTILNVVLYPFFGTTNLKLIFLLGVMLVSLMGKIGPAIVTAILSSIGFALLTYDISNIYLSEFQYMFTLIFMLGFSLLIIHLTVRTRTQAQVMHLAQQRTMTLLNLSRKLVSTRGIDKLLQIGTSYISEIFNSEIFALLPEKGELTVKAKYKSTDTLTSKDFGVAQWVYDLGQNAGLGTDTLPYSKAIYIPLLGSQGAIGVLRVKPLRENELLSPDEMHLLEACSNQLALALEVDRIGEENKPSTPKTEVSRVQNALLQSVSHDLRTPLVAVMGSASTLIEMHAELKPKQIETLGKKINLELEQLTRLINNILQLTYLEAETVQLQKEYYSLNDEIARVVKSMEKQLGHKPIFIKLPGDLPKIPFDRVLIDDVFINLIDNAIKFTPTKTSIEIFAFLEGDRVLVTVTDHGPGIVPDEVNKLFEKFYRGRMLSTERGLGLGLAICRSIITAHGGEIWATNLKDGGAAFCFTLPLS